ncbi:MAG: hypothetical protein IJ728_09330 [Selenomonadaceae bacterium]|nr:hypothetical protein [Selenomonadaceae bacterium]
MAVIVIANSNTLISGDDSANEFQLGAPNVSSPQFVTISAGSGDDTINNYNGVKSIIDVGGGDNVIVNSDFAVDDTILTGNGNNSIVNNPGAKNSFISTGVGNDTIDIWSEDRTTIKFGGGSNFVRICANTKLMLNTAESSNYELKYFNGASADVTLTNGAFNYTVRGSKEVNHFNYNITSSNLIIVGYGGEDILNIDRAYGDATLDSDDIVLSVADNGRIRIKNARAHTININGNQTLIGGYNVTPQQVIKNFMSALDKTNLKGSAAVDEAIKKSSNFKNMNEVIQKMIDDCRRINNADHFLRDCCNIILDNADTGAITGWDAGTSIVKTAETIVEEVGAIKNFSGDQFTVNGLTVKVPRAKNSVEQNIINGLFTWWVKNPLELIEKSYGVDYRFDNPNASVNELNVEFINDNSSALAMIGSTFNLSNGRAIALTLKINMRYYNDLRADNVDGATNFNQGNIRAGYLDRTLAHEFTHAVMAANIDHFNDLPAYLKEGTAELTHGISDERRIDIEKLASDPVKLLQSLNSNSNADQIFVEGVNAPAYAGGYILLNYFAKTSAN